MTPEEQEAFFEWLDNACTDWDGSQMKDEEEPRLVVNVGDLRKAKATIRAAVNEAYEKAANEIERRLLRKGDGIVAQTATTAVKAAADICRALKVPE